MFLVAVATGSARAEDICATVFVNPDTVSDGQEMSVVVDIMNCSGAAVTGVRPCPWGTPCPFPACIAVSTTGTAAVTPISGPDPVCPVDLVPFEHAYFTWRFLATGSGTVNFSITSAGWSAGAPVEYVAGGSLAVQRPAVLSATLYSSAVGGVVKYLKPVYVYLDVFNYGESAVDFAQTMTQSITGSGMVCLQPCPPDVVAPLCSPDPARRFATIYGGSATRFTWLYTARSPGTAVFSTAAFGIDHNFPLLPQAQSNTATLGFVIPDWTLLDVSVSGSSDVVQGESFDLKVSVSNTGSAPVPVCLSSFTVTLNGPSTPTCSGGGLILPSETVLADLGDNLVPLCFAGGQRREFTVRVHLPASIGEMTGSLSIEAVGAEAATGDPVPSVRVVRPFMVASGVSGLLDVDPNPFHPMRGGAVLVRYVIAGEQAGRLSTVRVYTVDGELVRTLADDALPVGVYDARWDGRNDSGEPVSSGIYVILFKAHTIRNMRKLAVIR